MPAPLRLPVTCLRCRHFGGDARILERELPGIRTLSSAFGAVRAADGLCALHERYVSGYAHCERFEAHEPAAHHDRGSRSRVTTRGGQRPRHPD